MAFNPFKKKEEQVKEAPKEELAIKAEKEKAVVPEKKKSGLSAVPGVLAGPHITEKANLLSEQGQYVFRVRKSTKKGAVKQAVEALYGVSVQGISMAQKPSKKVRLGRKQGVKPGFKKAIVRLKKGETIEVISR